MADANQEVELRFIKLMLSSMLKTIEQLHPDVDAHASVQQHMLGICDGVRQRAVAAAGDDIENEWESQISSQLRYRYSRAFEPAVEYYGGDSSKGFGPVALGSVRFSGARKLRWELGVIFGLDSESPDQTYRAMLEYEF